jgi:hypothetical protein
MGNRMRATVSQREQYPSTLAGYYRLNRAKNAPQIIRLVKNYVGPVPFSDIGLLHSTDFCGEIPSRDTGWYSADWPLR